MQRLLAVFVGAISICVAPIQVWSQDATLPPSAEHAVLTVEGRGVQIYSCLQTATGAAWVFVAPAARLFNLAPGAPPDVASAARLDVVPAARLDVVPAARLDVVPAARLDNDGIEVGTHGDGPVWHLQDGSSVSGQVIAKKASPDSGSVPWLLLKAVSTSGAGTLATVDFVRRSETRGGVSPATGCDATRLGEMARVPYQATYTFFSAK